VTAWDVPEDGFRFTDAYAFGRSVSSTRERFLVPKAKESQSWRRYWPLLDTAGLFRAFAEIDPTEAGVLEFATRYGWLGVAQDVEIDETGSHRAAPAEGQGEDESFEFDFAKGESLAFWADEILGMRHTLKVWDALSAMDVEDLQAWFHVEDYHGALRATYDAGAMQPRAVFTHERSPQTSVQQFQWYLSHAEIRRITEDPSTVALSFIRTLIEGRLREQAGARLVYQDESDLGPLAVNLVPKGLLGALWLQAAQSIEANKAFGKCRQCKNWFEIPPELGALGRRKDLGYCSVACREASDERDTRGDVPAPPPGNVVDLASEKERVEARRASGGR
jgi:hypothetical protein